MGGTHCKYAHATYHLTAAHPSLPVVSFFTTLGLSRISLSHPSFSYVSLPNHLNCHPSYISSSSIVLTFSTPHPSSCSSHELSFRTNLIFSRIMSYSFSYLAPLLLPPTVSTPLIFTPSVPQRVPLPVPFPLPPTPLLSLTLPLPLLVPQDRGCLLNTARRAILSQSLLDIFGGSGEKHTHT